jgi:hypothetical protein
LWHFLALANFGIGVVLLQFVTLPKREMSSHRVSTGDALEISNSNVGTTSGSDANSSSEKRDVDFGEKSGSIVQENRRENIQLAYSDIEAGEDVINHPAEKDDILRHTIHVEDDPSKTALTFRTWFLGMSWLPSQRVVKSDNFTAEIYHCMVVSARSHLAQNIDQNLTPTDTNDCRRWSFAIRWNYFCHLLL